MYISYNYDYLYELIKYGVPIVNLFSTELINYPSIIQIKDNKIINKFIGIPKSLKYKLEIVTLPNLDVKWEYKN